MTLRISADVGREAVVEKGNGRVGVEDTSTRRNCVTHGITDLGRLRAHPPPSQTTASQQEDDDEG